MVDPRTIILKDCIEGWIDQLKCFQRVIEQDMQDDPELYKNNDRHDFDNIIYKMIIDL